MLRAVQTQALSSQMSKLYDKVAAKLVPMQPAIPAPASFSANYGVSQEAKFEEPTFKSMRKRRYRRSRMAPTNSAVRASWY